MLLDKHETHEKSTQINKQFNFNSSESKERFAQKVICFGKLNQTTARLVRSAKDLQVLRKIFKKLIKNSKSVSKFDDFGDLENTDTRFLREALFTFGGFKIELFVCLMMVSVCLSAIFMSFMLVWKHALHFQNHGREREVPILGVSKKK